MTDARHREEVATLRLKRTYDPATAADGRRVLVERLWPRGMRKSDLKADEWLKEVAPSTELRQWFGHRLERWNEFQRRYRKELNAGPDAWASILEASRHGTVTLLYSARDELHNGALVLRDYLVDQRLRRDASPTVARAQPTVSGKSPAQGRRRRPRNMPRGAA